MDLAERLAMQGKPLCDEAWKEIEDLRAKLAAAEEDTARLDWLSDKFGGIVLGGVHMDIWLEQAEDLRAAIDKAKGGE